MLLPFWIILEQREQCEKKKISLTAREYISYTTVLVYFEIVFHTTSFIDSLKDNNNNSNHKKKNNHLLYGGCCFFQSGSTKFTFELLGQFTAVTQSFTEDNTRCLLSFPSQYTYTRTLSLAIDLEELIE